MQQLKEWIDAEIETHTVHGRKALEIQDLDSASYHKHKLAAFIQVRDYLDELQENTED